MWKASFRVDTHDYCCMEQYMMAEKARIFEDEEIRKQNSNYAKFLQNKELLDFLLSTGNKILVEASPYDTIWGVGMEEANPQINNPFLWKGQNLLGFALIEVRNELKRICQSYQLINWEQVKKEIEA